MRSPRYTTGRFISSSKRGEFKGKINSDTGEYIFATVNIECIDYEFYTKLCEAVQPILDELTEKMIKEMEAQDEQQ